MLLCLSITCAKIILPDDDVDPQNNRVVTWTPVTNKINKKCVFSHYSSLMFFESEKASL